MKVWIVEHGHRHGTDFRAAASEAAAVRISASIVRRDLDEIDDVEIHDRIVELHDAGDFEGVLNLWRQWQDLEEAEGREPESLSFEEHEVED